jgi:hypothetical protein
LRGGGCGVGLGDLRCPFAGVGCTTTVKTKALVTLGIADVRSADDNDMLTVRTA